MYLGRARLGERVSIPLQTRGASLVPAAPSAVPTYSVYASDGTKIETDKKMPVLGVGGVGRFLAKQFLDGDYAAGFYCVRVEYTVSATVRVRLFFFQVLPGGNAAGAYRALTYYDKTGGDYLVGETDAGALEIRRGPYL